MPKHELWLCVLQEEDIGSRARYAPSVFGDGDTYVGDYHHFDVLGSFPHPDVAEAIVEYLQRPDLPYRVTTSALMALANQKDDCQIDVILEYVQDEGWYRLFKRGAVQALGADSNR